MRGELRSASPVSDYLQPVANHQKNWDQPEGPYLKIDGIDFPAHGLAVTTGAADAVAGAATKMVPATSTAAMNLRMNSSSLDDLLSGPLTAVGN